MQNIEAPSNNLETSRPGRFREAFHRVFGSMVDSSEQDNTGSNVASLYRPSAETILQRREQLHKMAWEQRVQADHASEPPITSVMTHERPLTVADQQDIEWLQNSEPTSTDVIKAIEQGQQNQGNE